MFDQTYLKSIFKEDNIEISEMAHKIRSGYNENEVNLVARNHKNSGFFVKFFNYSANLFFLVTLVVF